MENKNSALSFFHRYLTLWVLICMVGGVLIGSLIPGLPEFINKFEVAGISLISAVLIWIMIFPMMLKVDFTSIRDVGKRPKGLFLTWVVNWLIKPFTMFAIAGFFFFVLYKNIWPTELAQGYQAGAILLGAAPCTAMVFVWSELTDGNPAYTVVQVATNNIILAFAYVPIVKLLLGISEVHVPWSTLILSVVLFVVIPLISGVLVRNWVINRKGQEYFENEFLGKFDGLTTVGLLLMLVHIFASQSQTLLSNPTDILLIAIPFTFQTLLIFAIGFIVAYYMNLTFDIAAPAALIGASNFFELALGVAISLFGVNSPAALATTVGVLTEVPTMLFLVWICNKNRDKFLQVQPN